MQSNERNNHPVTQVLTGYVESQVHDIQSNGIHRQLIEFSQTDSCRKPGGFEVSQEESTNPVAGLSTYVLNCLNDPNPKIVKDAQEFSYSVFGPFSEAGMRMSLPHVVYNLGEPIRQENQHMVSMHAAAMASPEGVGVLILGDKGVGKTTTSMMLGIEHGYEIIGNDLIIIKGNGSHPQIIGGSQIIDIRQSSLHTLPEIAAKIGFKISENDIHGREKKVSISPENIGIKTSKKIHEIGLIVRVSSHPDATVLTSTNVTNPIIERLRLSENLARYIRGLATPVYVTNNQIRGYFPSLDTESMNSMRNQLVDTLLNSCNFKYVSGKNASILANQINSLVKTI